MKILAYKTESNKMNGEIIEIENELESMQQFVGGYIESISLPDGLTIICNEDGRIKNYIHCADIMINNSLVSLVGDFFICGTKGEEFRSITKEEIEYVRKIVIKR